MNILVPWVPLSAVLACVVILFVANKRIRKENAWLTMRVYELAEELRDLRFETSTDTVKELTETVEFYRKQYDKSIHFDLVKRIKEKDDCIKKQNILIREMRAGAHITNKEAGIE